MSVLKLKPACKEYLWGGNKLIHDFHKQYEGKKLAETWELSCHPDGPSVIANGSRVGGTLAEYIESGGIEALGKNCRRFEEFPILIKFIDAKDDLSIQVHPDNSYALKNEGQYGKTEMWYIVDCKEGAFLYYGFAREITKEEFQQRIEDNTLLEVLNKVSVQKGDVLLIEAGTIHAIGKDIVIAEIQQNSNVTYRVYDYGRVDGEGRQRDLHIEKALAVTNRIPLVRNKPVSPHLVKCDYFTGDKLNLDGRMLRKAGGMVSEDSFAHFLIVEGNGTIVCGGETVNFEKGDSLFLPAGSGEFQVEGKCEALITTIGEKANPIRIAVDMTSRQIQAGLVDMNHICFEKRKMEIGSKEDYRLTVRKIGAAIAEMLEKNDLKVDNCIGIGAGLPGTVDRKKGRVIYSNNIGWENVPFVKELQKYIPLPVYINNNANCIALGEMVRGAAKEYVNTVLLTIGNGIGGSIILNGDIFEGRMPGGSELGHMSIQMDGPVCTCGRRGCLETYASIPALLKDAKGAMSRDKASFLWELCSGNQEKLTEDMIVCAARKKDKTAEEVIYRYIRSLCAGITNITNIFRPDLVLLSGSLFSKNEYLLEEIHSFIEKECFGRYGTGVPDIKAVNDSENAGLTGAANLI